MHLKSLLLTGAVTALMHGMFQPHTSWAITELPSCRMPT